MKKIFVFLILMVVSFALKAQYPIQQNLGSDSTIIYIKGAARTVGGFINGTYTDTAAANLTRIRQYQAAQIFTTGDSAIWFRMPGATKWVRIMPATPPSPNVDTSYWSLSGNYVADRVATPRLGTTTGHELNIITNDSIRLTIPVYGIRRVTGNENRYLVIDTTIGSNMYVGYMDGGSGSTYTAGNGLTLSGSQFKLGSPLTENTTITGNSNAYSLSMTGFSDLALSAGTGTNNEIDFYSSGNMIIRADEGELRFGSVSEIRALSGVLLDIVPSGASTDSILTWNATNKAVRKRQLSEVVTTPTLQQVLTAGSTLTTNNTIIGDGFNFTMQDFNDIIITGDNSISMIGSVSGADGELLLDLGNAIISSYSTSDNTYRSDIYIKKDSILITPKGGVLNIDSIRTWSGISDTTHKKPMTWDTRNGRWEYAANWPQQKINLVFGAGSGADADTTAFTTSAIYGSFYNDADTIVVTSMRSVLQGTSPDVTYKVWYNDSLNVEAGATALVTAGSQVTNTTTGTNVTSFDVTKIPPGVWVWVKTSTVATKPKYFSLTVNGYRK